jgi:hypothetical protein
MNFDYTEQLVKTTDSLIYTAAKVDGAERVVYWVESSGMLHQDDLELAAIWNFTLGFAVQGEMALTPNSAVLIVADTRGVVTALQVAEIPDTISPSDFPSDMPSMAPSGLGTTAPVAAPVAPSVPVTEAPVAPTSPVSTPTSAPVSVPTGSPVAAPTSPPSAAFGRSSLVVATAFAVVSACLLI